jgi:hypothetical protein
MNEPPLDLQRLSAFAASMLASERARVLTEKYRLQALRQKSIYLGTLFLVDLFDQLFAEAPEYFAGLSENPTVLEIGAKDFESAPSLVAVFPGAKLTGVELEPDRLETDHLETGVSSQDRARARLSALGSGHRYFGKDIVEYFERHEVVIWLHPFFDETRLREWGLPASALRPGVLFEHALSLLRPNALLLIVNQERSEDEAQRALFALHSSRFRAYRALEVPLWFRARDEPAYVHLARAIE